MSGTRGCLCWGLAELFREPHGDPYYLIQDLPFVRGLNGSGRGGELEEE